MFVERAAGKAEAAFRQHAAATGIDADWQADIGSNVGQVSRAVVLRSREADIVIIGQYDRQTADGSVPEALVEHTVLHAGRPVLVVPYAGHFPAFGRRPVVAWNASREAARAVHDALPLLALAEEAVVLALAPAAGPGAEAVKPAPPEDSVRHLTEHGVNARGDHVIFDPASIEPAERLLSYVAETGGDLLIMGAAGQQLGRAAAKRSLTRQILEKMTLPVLLSY